MLLSTKHLIQQKKTNSPAISNRAVALRYRTGVRRDTGPQIGTFLRHGTGDGRALHFALVVHYDPCVVLKVKEDTVSPAERFPLPDHDRGHDLLTEFRLTLLDGGHEHVADASSGQTVQTTTDAMDCDHVQVLGTCWEPEKRGTTFSTSVCLQTRLRLSNQNNTTVSDCTPRRTTTTTKNRITTLPFPSKLTCVVGAVDDGSDWQTQRDAELSSRGSSSSCVAEGRQEKQNPH